jgi:hypothetical protein
MAINELPCGKCKNYDPILGPNERETRRGWCIPRSKYAHKEGPGQVFPPGVARVGPKELAQPYIVKKDFVHSMCEHARPTDTDPVEEKQKRQVEATTQRSGRRVHT